MKLTQSELETAVGAAIAAPSVLNIQPWLFESRPIASTSGWIAADGCRRMTRMIESCASPVGRHC